MKISNVPEWLHHVPEGPPPEMIVIHSTEGASAISSYEYLRDERPGIAYHAIVDRNGDVLKLAPIGSVVAHAGSSYGPREMRKGRSRKQNDRFEFERGITVNGYTKGLAFANCDNAQERITDAQFVSMGEFVQKVITAFPTIAWITDHKTISPGRKVDPNAPNWDLDQFAQLVKLKVWRLPK